MRPTLMLLCALLWPAGSMPAQTTDESLWRFAHPDAKFLLGVDWQKAKNSPAGKMIERQFTASAKGSAHQPPKGLEFLESVERVLVSSPNLEGVSAQSPGQLVIALEGKIDREALKKSLPAGTAIERYKGIDLYLPPKGVQDEMILALVNDRIALGGDRQSLETVLEESAAGLKDQGLLEKATHLAEQCEIWMVGNAPPVKKGSSGNAGMGQQFEDIESLELGISLTRGLGLEMNMNMATVESAQGMAMLSQMMMGMISNQTRQSDDFTRALRKLKVESRGKRVHLALDIPTSVLEKGVAQMKTSIRENGPKTLEALLKGGSGGGTRSPGTLAATARMEPPAPVVRPREMPARPKTIKIVGLDTGDREIPFRRE